MAAARATYAGSGPLLVLSGRLEWEKGVHIALAALPRLRRRHPGLRLVVAGTGTMADELRVQAKRLRLGRSVHFAGQLPTGELAPLLAAADVALAPSLYEPFGLVALEAAVAGTPLVVGDTGGLAEFVDPDRTGVRVTPGDPAALAAGVEQLLADQVAARRMAHAARAAVAGRSWPQVAEQTAAVYQRAVREEKSLRTSLGHPTGPLRMVVPGGNLLTGEG